MSEMIAYCGLDCAKCDVFLATQAGDAAQKAKIAERWANQLKMEFTQEDISCDGCKSERISAWCRRVCKIRPCAETRDVNTCASCTDYVCKNLDVFLADEPEARMTLEEMRRIV